MFLLERFFGIATYMLILLFVCFFLLKTNVTCKSILRFYVVCLCVMAFFYKPYITADLYRIFEQMEYFSSMDFGLFWKDFALESSMPFARLLFWVFGKTGVFALLPAFSALICYSLIFYTINKTKEIYHISNQTIAIVLFYIMTTSIYISVIGGIRMMLALSMIVFAYFRGTVEKKITIVDIFLYGLSLFTHSVSAVVVCICVCASLFASGKNIWRKIGLSIGAIGVGGVAVVLFSDRVDRLYQKFLEYVLGDKHSDLWEYMMGAIIILMLFFMFLEIHRLCKHAEYVNVKKYNLASIISVALAVCFCFEFSMFYRFGGHVAVLFSIPSMMVVLEKTKGKSSVLMAGVDFRSIMIVLTLIMAAISCARGSLCSLKFFEL